VIATIRISATIRGLIVDAVAAVLPNEGCGVLGVLNGAVTSVYPIPNIDAAPDRYTMDPATLVRALRGAEQSGEPIGAIYHSHPGGPAYPSIADRATDVERDWVHVIVDLGGIVPTLRAFRLTETSVFPVEIAGGHRLGDI